jgi:hypothetical protein
LSRTIDAVASVIPGGRLAMGVLAAVLVLLVRWLVRGRRPRRRTNRRDGEPGGGPILAAFLRLIRQMPSSAKRTEEETAREYLERVGALEHAQGAVRALEQEMYGATPPDQASSDAAVTAFAELTESKR